MIHAERAAMQRSLPAVALVAGSAATVTIVRGEPHLSLADDSAAALATELVAAALAIAAATATWRAGAAFPVLLAAAAVAWLAAEWNTPGAGPAFTAGLVLYAAWPPLLAAAALRGLDERPLGRPTGILLAVAFVSCVGALGLASAAVFDPDAQGCVHCPANRLLVVGDAGLGHAFGRAGLALTAAWTAAFAVLASVRFVRSSPARRWTSPASPDTAGLAGSGISLLFCGYASREAASLAPAVDRSSALVVEW